MARKLDSNGLDESIVINSGAGIFHLNGQYQKVKTAPNPALFANSGDYRTTVPKYRMKP